MLPSPPPPPILRWNNVKIYKSKLSYGGILLGCMIITTTFSLVITLISQMVQL